MNINIEDTVKNILQALQRPYASRDWLIALGLFGVLFLFCILWAGFLFFSIESGSIFGSTSTSEQNIIKLTRAQVEKTIAIYQVRQVNYAARNFQVPPLTDPAPPPVPSTSAPKSSQ